MTQITKFANCFRAGRKIRGYNQKEMSDLLEISQATMSKLEKGQTEPLVSLMLNFCNLIKVDPGITIQTGMLFFEDEEIDSTNFKLGNKSQTGLRIKTVEFLPFVEAVDMSGMRKFFEFYLTENQVDPEIFCVPMMKLPVEIGAYIFDFVEDNIGKKKFLSNCSKIYKQKNYLRGVSDNKKTAKDLTQMLLERETFFSYRDIGYGIELSLENQLTETARGDRSLTKFLKYKTEILKSYLRGENLYDELECVKINNLKFELRLN